MPNEKVTFSIANDNDLLIDIEVLLRFIKKSHAIFFPNTCPQHILKASLDELEFRSNDSGDNKCLIIKYKNKIVKFPFSNSSLDPPRPVIPDKKQFIEELKQAKFLDPKLKLKNILAKLNKKNMVIHINEAISSLQKKYLNSSDKKNKVGINFLFNYLKISLLRILSLKKFHGSAEFLLASAKNLTQDCLFDLNTIIFPSNNIDILENIAKKFFLIENYCIK